MSAIKFAEDYQAWLKRSAPSVTEPQEPDPAAYGVGEELAEPLRLKVRLMWERDVIETGIRRGAMQKTI